MNTEDLAQGVERQRCARQLLTRPLLTVEAAPEELALVQAHADWLTGRFWALLEYRLDIARDHARLVKAGPPRSPAELRRASGLPFSPRAYAYLTLAIAVLHDAPSRLQLGHLLAEVRGAAAEAGLSRDPMERRAERGACAAALLRLRSWQAFTGPSGPLADVAFAAPLAEEHPEIAKEPGAEAQYSETQYSETQYTVNHAIVRALVTHPPGAQHSVSQLLWGAEPAAAAGSAQPERAEGRAVLRRLVEHAIVYRDELPEPQRLWLGRHQQRVAAALTDFLGGTVEIRAEGVALLVPDTGVAAQGAAGTGGWPQPDVACGPPLFPSSTQVDRMARGLLARLVARMRPAAFPTTEVVVSADVFDAELQALREETCIPSAVVSDTELAARLCEVGLLAQGGAGAQQHTESAWRLLAGAARYAWTMERDGVRQEAEDGR